MAYEDLLQAVTQESVQSQPQNGYEDLLQSVTAQQEQPAESMTQPVMPLNVAQAQLEASQAAINQTQSMKPKTALFNLIPQVTNLASAATIDQAALPQRIEELEKGISNLQGKSAEELGIDPSSLLRAGAASYLDLIELPADVVDLSNEIYQLHPFASKESKKQAEDITKGLSDKYRGQVASAARMTPEELKYAKEYTETQSPLGRLAGDIGPEGIIAVGALRTGKAAKDIYGIVKKIKAATSVKGEINPIASAVEEAVTTFDEPVAKQGLKFRRNGVEQTGEIIGQTNKNYKVKVGDNKPIYIPISKPNTELISIEPQVLGELVPAVDGTMIPRIATNTGQVNTAGAIQQASQSPQRFADIQTLMRTLGEKGSVPKEYADKFVDFFTFGRNIIDKEFINLGTGEAKKGNDFITMFDKLVNSHSKSLTLGRDFAEFITDSPVATRRAYMGFKEVPAKISNDKVMAASERLLLEGAIEEADIQSLRKSLKGDAYLAPSHTLKDVKLPSRVQDDILVDTTYEDLLKRRDQLFKEFDFNDPEINHVYRNQREVLDSYQDLLIEKGMLNADEARQFYVPHNVILDSTKPIGGKGKPGFLFERKGSKRQITFQEDPLGTLKRHIAAVEKLDKNHDFITATAREFGTPYKKDMIIPEGYVKYRIPTPGEIYTDIISYSQNMIDDMTLIAEQTLRDSTNVIPPTIKKRAALLETRGYSPVDALTKAQNEFDLRTVVMPKDIVNFMGTMTQTQPRHVIEQTFNKFRNMWKSNVTYSGYNLAGPQFQFRNVLTELRNMNDAVGASYVDPSGSFSYGSFKYLGETADSLFKGKLPRGQKGKIVKEYMDHIGGSNLYAEVSGGTGAGHSSEYLEAYKKGSPKLAAVFNWDDRVKTFSANRENLFRLQTYMYDRLEKGLSIGDAARNVDKIFYNYGHLTRPEKRLFRDGLAPFYTYFKKDFARSVKRWKNDPLKTGAYMMIPYIATNSWNMLIDPELEMQIQDSGMYAGSIHIIMPGIRTTSGVNRVMVLDTSTSLEKFVNAPGLINSGLSQTLNAWREMASGRSASGDVGEVAKQQVLRTGRAIPQTLGNILAPEVKVIPDIQSNTQRWSTGEKPIIDFNNNETIAQNMIDIGKYILNSVSPQTQRISEKLIDPEQPALIKAFNYITGTLKDFDEQKAYRIIKKERKITNSFGRAI